MNKRREFAMNIGLPSILLIFVVLCLISFGVLSLVSANSDRKLSQKVLDRSSEYYEACNQAEEMLYNVDTQLHDAYNLSDDYSSYIALVQNVQNSYMYTISDSQALQVDLEFIYPSINRKDDSSSNKELYKITTWKIVNTAEYDYDEHLHVIP